MTSLARKDFKVWEDKIEQQVEYFSRDTAPLSAGIILDVSNSMRLGLPSARAAADTFLNLGERENEYFLIQFNDTARLVQGFTTDIGKLRDSLAMVRATGNTSLYDAVYLGLETVHRGRNDRKVLLVITDGADNNSRYTLSAVKRFAEEHDVLIYTVGIGVNNRAEWHLPGLSPEARLKSLAEMTGGKAFFPDSIKELPDVCARINVDLRNQYILGYRSMNTARDSKWRKIRVTINKNPGQKPLHVRAKSGYYASTIARASTP